jgi:arylsulfatase A-like enzyme
MWIVHASKTCLKPAHCGLFYDPNIVMLVSVKEVFMNLHFERFIAFCCLAACISACSENSNKAELVHSSDGKGSVEIKPNILLIQVDDLGFDDLAVHGNTLISTPNLDALAAESISFDQFYVSSVCAPTRASLLTGRHFLRTGVSGVHAGRDFVNLNETMISDVALQSGYKTAMWGKWHSGKTQGYFPWDRGFEQAYYATLYNYFDNVGLMNGETINTRGFATDRITDFAIDYIKEHKSAPFFAYLSYMAPHNPWRAPEEKITKYLEQGLSKPMASLYGMIDNLDANIGRVLQQLEKSGIAQNTIVIFISDNGPWLRSYRFGLSDKEWQLRNPNQRRGFKSKNWENGIHSPLFIRWKGHYKPATISHLVSAEDLYPSIIDWMQSDYVSSGKQKLALDGVSIVPFLAALVIPQFLLQTPPQILILSTQLTTPSIEEQPPLEKAIFSAWASPLVARYIYDESDPTGFYYPLMNEYLSQIKYDAQRLAIRKGDYKLVRNEDNKGRAELFNIKTDPRESIIIENQANLKEKLNTELQNWYEGILQSAHAYKMPEFQVGYKGRQFSQIYAASASEMSLSLSNSAHALAGWTERGEQASYKIKVHERGEYQIRLILNSLQAESLTFAVEIGDKSVSNAYRPRSNEKIGTLIRYESAYWENFDLPETFKTSIHNYELGTISLDQSMTTLRVKLSEISPEFDPLIVNQIIAIQLIKLY